MLLDLVCSLYVEVEPDKSLAVSSDVVLAGQRSKESNLDEIVEKHQEGRHTEREYEERGGSAGYCSASIRHI